MKRKLWILVLLLVVQSAFAESAKPSITKIVYRTSAPDIPAESFASKPKTLYIGGETYARIEEEPDPEQRIHGLIVCSEPDIWMINLYEHKGRHIIDPGPTFVAHHNIIGKNAPENLSDLEFGKELDFFNKHQATRLKAQTIEEQHCEALEINQSNYRVVLYLRSDKNLPFKMEIFKDGALNFSIRYLSYETGIPFNASLFRPPEGITISEEKTSATSEQPKQVDDSWMQCYYQHPQPELFEAEVKKLQQAGALQNENALFPLAAFFSRLFHGAAPARLAQWLTFIKDLPEAEQQVFLLALKWADTRETQDHILSISKQEGRTAIYARKLLKAKVSGIDKITDPAPEQLDMCWGAFFATGDPTYALIVIKCAVKQQKKDVINMSQQAARWSLRSLSLEHEKLRAIKADFYKTASPEERKALDEIFPK